MKSVLRYLTERVSDVKQTKVSEIEEEIGVEIVQEIMGELGVELDDLGYTDKSGEVFHLTSNGNDYLFVPEDKVDEYLVEEQESMMDSVGGFGEYIKFLDEKSQNLLITKGSYNFMNNPDDITSNQREQEEEYWNEDEDMQEQYETVEEYIKAIGLDGDSEEAYANAMSRLKDIGDIDNLITDKNIDFNKFFDELCSGKYTVGHNGRTLSKELFIEDIGGYQEVYEMDSGILARCDY